MSDYYGNEPDPAPWAHRGVQVTCSSCDEPMPLEKGDTAPFICEDCRRAMPSAQAHSQSMFELAVSLARKHAAEVLARKAS